MNAKCIYGFSSDNLVGFSVTLSHWKVFKDGVIWGQLLLLLLKQVVGIISTIYTIFCCDQALGAAIAENRLPQSGTDRASSSTQGSNVLMFFLQLLNPEGEHFLQRRVWPILAYFMFLYIMIYKAHL